MTTETKRKVSDKNKNNEETTKTMNTTPTKAIDPICGMNVDTTTALHAEREGKTWYFCGEHCREKFLSTPADAKPEKKSGSCCCG
jgi:YHS domain-containing protein